MNAARTNAAAAPAVPGTADVLINFIAFQAGWFACVLGAARGWPWTGTALAAVVVTLHLWRCARPAQELTLVAIAVVIGLAWDSLLINLGLVDFPVGTVVDDFAPQWIVALWALFATTLNVSLRWLQDRLLVAALLGAMAGPLAYWGGGRLGALELLDPVPALVALAIGWAVMTPLLLEVARHHDGVHAAE